MSAPTAMRPRGDSSGAVPSEFSHEAVMYAGEGDFLTGTIPFVRDGIEKGEPVLVVVDAAKITRMREALGSDADRVQFADMSAIGLNPARIIPAWRDFVADHGTAARPVRGIGEPIFASRTADQLIECQRHESLLNVAFAGMGTWRLLCPYDVTSLSPLVIEEARRSHPYVLDQGLLEPSVDYRGLEESGRPFDSPLPWPPGTADTFAFAADSLRDVRLRVMEFATQTGLDASSSSDLALAAHEMAANSVRYGGGGGTVISWATDTAAICEIQDRGRIDAPLAGRERPSTTSTGGRGLWLANHLCDLVQIRSLASGGVVRLHKFR